MPGQEPLYAGIDMTGFRAFLQYTGDDTDPKLALMELILAAAREKVEDLVGPLTPRPVVQQVRIDRRGQVLLRPWPVLSLESVSHAGTTLDAAQVQILPGGVLAVPRFCWGEPLTVSMTVGRNPLPSELILATYIIGSHLWETQRGRGSRPQSYGGEPAEVVPRGFAVPTRAEELLAGHRVPGVS